MFELGLRTTLNEITLGLHVHVFLEAFMVWLNVKSYLLTIPQLTAFTFLPESKYKNNSHSCKEKGATCPCGRASESTSEGPEKRDQEPLRQPFHLL